MRTTNLVGSRARSGGSIRALCRHCVVRHRIGLSSNRLITNDDTSATQRGYRGLTPRHSPTRIHRHYAITSIFFIGSGGGRVRRIVVPIANGNTGSVVRTFLTLKLSNHAIEGLCCCRRQRAPFLKTEIRSTG